MICITNDVQYKYIKYNIHQNPSRSWYKILIKIKWWNTKKLHLNLISVSQNSSHHQDRMRDCLIQVANPLVLVSVFDLIDLVIKLRRSAKNIQSPSGTESQNNKNFMIFSYLTSLKWRNKWLNKKRKGNAVPSIEIYILCMNVYYTKMIIIFPLSLPYVPWLISFQELSNTNHCHLGVWWVASCLFRWWRYC